MPAPGLIRSEPAAQPRGVVLMLHGGAKTGLEPVGPRSASRWRTDRMREVIEPRVHEAGLALWMLQFGVRGWNLGAAAEPSPVPDGRWALDQVAAAHPGLPVVLLGHSMELVRRSTSPTTPASSAWSASRRGSSPAIPSPPWPDVT